MPLHDGELAIDAALVRSLLLRERPDLASLPLTHAGAGTENRMFRLGEELLVRLPRTAEKAASLRTEREWLPRLSPSLTFRVPEPVHAGSPSAAYPAEWAIYRWIDGAVPDTRQVTDQATFGSDLARFVRELHGLDLMGAERAGDLSWYRGGSLRDADEWIRPAFDGCRELIGAPDAEHAAVWDLARDAREAYWNELRLDQATWLRARGWAIGVAVTGIPYYWDTFPEFVAECRARLDEVLA